MIGRFLATLTTSQEDAVLTERLARAPRHINANGCRCLVGVIDGWQWVNGGPRSGPNAPDMFGTTYGPRLAVGIRFDDLCLRFGEEHINAAIRNRILANQARRALRGVHKTVPA